MTPDDAHATDLAYIVSRFTNVHASIRCKLQTDSDITLREALLDAELEEWDMKLPQSLRYRLEQHAEETAVMLKGVSHQYRDFWTARIYDHYRWCRILVNELLLTQPGPFSSEDAAQRSSHSTSSRGRQRIYALAFPPNSINPHSSKKQSKVGCQHCRDVFCPFYLWQLQAAR
jgi:uncharacterized membrane-anchored protein YhcB (DUF1043 family)